MTLLQKFVSQGIFSVLCGMHLGVSYICCVCCDLVWNTVPCHFVLPSTCYLWTESAQYDISACSTWLYVVSFMHSTLTVSSTFACRLTVLSTHCTFLQILPSIMHRTAFESLMSVIPKTCVSSIVQFRCFNRWTHFVQQMYRGFVTPSPAFILQPDIVVAVPLRRRGIVIVTMVVSLLDVSKDASKSLAQVVHCVVWFRLFQFTGDCFHCAWRGWSRRSRCWNMLNRLRCWSGNKESSDKLWFSYVLLK